MKMGSLYLIPSFLAETNDERSFPPVNIEIIAGIDHFIVENIRTARRFLRKIGYRKDFDTVRFFEMSKHTDPVEFMPFLDPLEGGLDMGLMSEAGMPCVADPGALIVARAHEKGYRVVPLTGPSSIFLALMASGFNGQKFQFHGYLPIDRKDREKAIRDLERQALANRHTQIFMETPYRNNQLMETIVHVCKSETLLCIASMITHETMESIQTKTVGEWRKKMPDLHKLPAIFLIY